MKKTAQIIFALLAVMLLLWADWLIRGPEWSHRQQQVVREFDAIQQFPGAVVTKKNAKLKAGVGVVYADFTVTGHTQDEVEKWYRDEFERQQWDLRITSTYLGRRQAIYCRNNENAMLSMPQDASGPVQFVVQMRWSTFDQCK